MPYVKSISVRTTVNRSLAYILDPDKTEDLLYTTSLNCMTNAKEAYLNMKLVYEQFSGKRFDEPIPEKGKGRVKAIHYIQSFSPDENITPETAHRIAKAFVRKTFGEDCQVVIATHCDKSHLHNHIILNTYSITGRKFNDNKTTRNHVREYSDRVCLAFGIQSIQKNQGTGRSIAYNEWNSKKRGTSWKQKIRLDIDSLIGLVKNIDELLYELELQGYIVKKGKHISVKAEGQQRFVRLKTLGEAYTPESLDIRIHFQDRAADSSPLRETYQNAIEQCKMLTDVHRLSAQLAIINRDNIHSIGELEGKLERLKEEYESARQEINRLIVQADRLNSLAKQAESYFALMDKGNLSATEQLMLKMHGDTVKRNNISNREDYDRLKALQSSTTNQVTALRVQFNQTKQLYDVYDDITQIYYDISKGDYISRLVKEKKREEEKSMESKKHKSRRR